MIEKITLFIDDGEAGIGNAVLRYALLERISSSCAQRGVGFLAFGVEAAEVRLVVEGQHAAVRNVIRGIKVGTGRAARTFGHKVLWAETVRECVAADDLTEAVAWAHRSTAEGEDLGPLSTPWTSHRDVMKYRRARFFDASVLDGRVDIAAVHRLAGGGDLPEGWPPKATRRETLNDLLRVAASVLGVLPADRTCFALFVQLAKARGWATREIAAALMLSTRRVRQLTGSEAPALAVALETLGDARLLQVP